MRVLVADKLPDQARVRLARAGFEVRAEAGLSGDALAEELAAFGPDVLVVRSTRVEARHLDAAPSLALIVRAGAGVNTIAVDEASARGVYVANCPGKNATAVAELAFGLILSLDRHIPDNVADLRAGTWNKGLYGRARGLRGRTLGIIGCGGIGSEVARLGLAFGMEVLAWSRRLDDARAIALGVRRYDTPEDVARRAEVLSVHLALAPETRGFVGESVFAEMKPGALFINTSRAEVVDEDALRRAIEDHGVRAGLDVFSGEPSGKSGSFEHPLAQLAGVYGTHHIGASTEQAQEAVADEACRVVEAFAIEGQVPNCVNLKERGRPEAVLVVRHLDRVGVLAGVLAHLRAANANVGEMENLLFAGRKAAVARIEVNGSLDEADLDRIRATEHVLSVALVRASHPRS